MSRMFVSLYFWKRIAGVLLFALFLVGFVMLWYDVSYRELLSTIRERGEPVNFSQLKELYAPVAASEQTRSSWIAITTDASKIRAGMTAEEGEVAEQFPQSEFYEAANENLTLGESWPPLAGIDKFLSAREQLLRRCAEFTSSQGEASPRDYHFETALGDLMKDLSGASEIRKSLWLALLRDACQKQPHHAVERVEQFGAIYKANLDRPAMLGSLSRLADFFTLCRGIEVICQADVLSDDDITRCRLLLQEIDLRADWKRTLISERAFAIDSYATEFRHPLSGDANWFVSFFDRLRLLRMYESLFVEIEKPWPEIALYCDEIHYTWTMEPTANSAFAVAINTTEQFLLAETILRLADTSLAIRQFGNVHHQLPGSLQALVPDFCKDVPLNPITGKPFDYAVTADGRCILEADASLILSKRRMSSPLPEETEPKPTKIIFKLKFPVISEK